jgi:hypothetical protein
MSCDTSPSCSETLSSSCAPRLSAVSGIACCGSGAGVLAGACDETLSGESFAMARSVSMISARLASSCNVSSARFACSGVSASAPAGTGGVGAAPVWAKAGQANSTKASSIEGRNLCDIKALSKNNPAMTAALDVMSGRLLFAAIVCRKFAIEAAMSWHLSA